MLPFIFQVKASLSFWPSISMSRRIGTRTSDWVAFSWMTAGSWSSKLGKTSTQGQNLMIHCTHSVSLSAVCFTQWRAPCSNSLSVTHSVFEWVNEWFQTFYRFLLLTTVGRSSSCRGQVGCGWWWWSTALRPGGESCWEAWEPTDCSSLPSVPWRQVKT